MHRAETATPSVLADPTGGSLTRTFVVRLWRPPMASEGTAPGLRGVVEHLRSGESLAFSDEDTLLAFLRDAGGAT